MNTQPLGSSRRFLLVVVVFFWLWCAAVMSKEGLGQPLLVEDGDDSSPQEDTTTTKKTCASAGVVDQEEGTSTTTTTCEAAATTTSEENTKRMTPPPPPQQQQENPQTIPSEPQKKFSYFVGSYLGKAQKVWRNDKQEQIIRNRIEKAMNYIDNVVYATHEYLPIRDLCVTHHTDCAIKAVQGHCETNPEWMLKFCAPLCETCHLLEPDYSYFEGDVELTKKCAFDPSAPSAWKPGDLNQMFERIVNDSELIETYNVQVLSRPNNNTETNHGNETDHDEYDDDDDDDDPWIITLDHFFTQKEANHLIALGATEGEPRIVEADEDTSARTSTNVYCKGTCHEDPVTQLILQRVWELIGLNGTVLAEPLQIITYQTGQFHEAHVDYSEEDVKWACGPRILTVFLYLNDVEQGGGTRFIDLDHHDNVIIEPAVGRIAIWPSVLNDYPYNVDDKTEHEGMPVIKGVKHGANLWVHQGPMDWECL